MIQTITAHLKQGLLSYRQAIWIARYLILGFIVFGTVEKILMFQSHELNGLQLTFELTAALICTLIPFAYGIDSSKQE